MITQETKIEADKLVPRQRRYGEIKFIMRQSKEPLTAKEIAVEMYKLDFSVNTDRNNSQPRLTELVNRGEVAVVGKKKCRYTGRTVSLYALKEE